MGALKTKELSNEYVIRPLHIVEEVQTKDLLFVGIKTIEERVQGSSAVIANTWGFEFQHIIFFLQRVRGKEFNEQLTKPTAHDIVRLSSPHYSWTDDSFSLM